MSRSRVAHGASGSFTRRCDVATLNPFPFDGLNTLPRGGPGTGTRRESFSPLLLLSGLRPSPPKCSARRDDRVLPLVVDRSGLVYVLDGVNDGDSRWSPGILRPALIPSAGFNQCRNCIVESEMKSSQVKLDRGEYPEARPPGGESGRVSPPPHGRVRSVHARRPLLPLPRNVRRHLRGDAGAQGGEVQAPGAETTAGVRLVTSAGAIRLCGSIDGHHETR